jgi:hypothetical protein
MSIVRRAAALLTAAVIAFAPGVASAAFEDRVMNKEGFWGVDVDGDSCAASMAVGDGSIFMLKGTEGQVTFAVFFAKPVRAGKKGEVRTEAYGFEFKPSFTDDKGAVFFNGDLDSRAIAALRLAKEVRVLIDGRLVNAATFENTGFEGALDALIACSKGEAGWWGQGVAGEQDAAAPGATQAPAKPELPFNEEGFWALEASSPPDVCTAYGLVDDHLAVVLIGAAGSVGLALNSETEMRRGRKALVETDTYSFAFKPDYDGPKYMFMPEPMDSQAMFALRRAKSLRIRIDGRAVADAHVEGTGLAGLLDSLIACSNGERGWWGEGAKPADR